MLFVLPMVEGMSWLPLRGFRHGLSRTHATGAQPWDVGIGVSTFRLIQIGIQPLGGHFCRPGVACLCLSLRVRMHTVRRSFCLSFFRSVFLSFFLSFFHSFVLSFFVYFFHSFLLSFLVSLSLSLSPSLFLSFSPSWPGPNLERHNYCSKVCRRRTSPLQASACCPGAPCMLAPRPWPWTSPTSSRRCL